MDELPGKKETISARRVAFYMFFALLGFLTVIVVVLTLQVGKVIHRKMEEAKLVQEITQVQTAALNFYEEYGRYPDAPDNASLTKILTGAIADENTRKISFLTVKPSDENPKGEMLDSWGTPLQLSATADGKLHIRSAGPDQIFGTADDYQDDIDLSVPR